MALSSVAFLSACTGGSSSSGSEAGAGATGLLVSGTLPPDNAVDVPLDAAVSLTFNRELDCSLLPFGAVLLESDAGPVAATLQCSGATLQLAPTSRLAYGTTFTLTASTDIVGKDLEPLNVAQSFRFTTIPDTEPPTLSVTTHPGTESVGHLASVELRGTVSDNDSIAALRLAIDGGPPTDLAIDAGTFSTTVVATADAVAVVTAVDPAGNTRSASIQIHAIARGELDSTFGGDVQPFDGTPDGFVFRDLGNDNDTIRAGALGASGNLLAVGASRPGIGFDMVVWSFTADGSVDATFGSDLDADGTPDGYALLDGPAGGHHDDDWANGVDVDPSGNIVVVGQSRNAAGHDDLVLARFTPSGQLDTSFGPDVLPADGVPDGFVTHSLFGTSNEAGMGVLVAEDGSLYAVGRSDYLGTRDMVLWRFTSAGALDTTFAAGRGYLSHSSASGIAGTDEGMAVLEDGLGNLLVAGHSSSRPTLWRVTEAGLLDLSFGGDVHPENGQPDGFALFTDHTGQGAALALDPTGAILMAGYVYVDATNRDDAAVWRYLADGTPDLTFGGDYDLAPGPDGYARHHAAGGSTHRDRARAVALDTAGNILIAGETEGPGSNPDVAVWRYRPDGTLDPTFGADVNPMDGTPDGFLFNGTASSNSLDQAVGLFLDPGGRIVLTGTSFGVGGANATVWRVR